MSLASIGYITIQGDPNHLVSCQNSRLCRMKKVKRKFMRTAENEIRETYRKRIKIIHHSIIY